MRQLFIVIFCMFVVLVEADTLRGTVVDKAGKPVAFASVYIKENPHSGTMSNADGTFELHDSTTSTRHFVCSFIGYKTVEKTFNTFPHDSITITLIEQPIALDATEVHTKLTKKEKRKIKRTVVDRFRAQMIEDFAARTAQYSVVSTYEWGQDARQLIFHEVIGVLTEYPVRKSIDSDSIALEVTSSREIETNELIEAYNRLNNIVEENNAKAAKKKKKQSHTIHNRPIDEREISVHRYFWGGTMPALERVLYFDKPSMWDYTIVNGQNALIYTDKRNYLGIFKMTLKINFYVDPSSLSIDKIVQTLDAEVNIPFGYTLNSDELAMLNALQVSVDTIDKYKVRHIESSIVRNIFFTTSNGNKVVKEKNINAKMTLISNKKQRLNYNARSKIVVTSSKITDKKPKQ